MSDEDRRQLKRVREACLEVARGNLTGCCGAVACMVAGTFGGRIVTAKVNGCRHYWNRLPCGTEIDLTSCQFRGDGFTPLTKGRATHTPQLTPIEFLLFTRDVLRVLSSVEVESAA